MKKGIGMPLSKGGKEEGIWTKYPKYELLSSK